jgi:hypothetical protein
MKSPRYPILMGILWLFAMGSLLITHFWLNGKSKTTRAAPGLDLYIKGLDPDLKIQLGDYEDAALIMEDGRILLIGRDFEQETDRLINANIVDYKKVDIPLEDPLKRSRNSITRKKSVWQTVTALSYIMKGPTFLLWSAQSMRITQNVMAQRAQPAGNKTSNKHYGGKR